MMGYKDRAWCGRWLSGQCINANCERAFTAQDRIEATEWWGGDNFPIIIGDCYTGECNYITEEML